MNTPIKLITQPSVYLIGRQTVDGTALQSFLDDHGVESWHRDTQASNPESLVEIAGRLCYMSYDRPRPGGNAAYISHILDTQHGSVCEHAVWSLIVTGVSRSLSHELVRHRTISPSQLSQRYVDSSDVAFVIPPELLEDANIYDKCKNQHSFFLNEEDFNRRTLFHVWLQTCEQARAAYDALADALLERLSWKLWESRRAAGLTMPDGRDGLMLLPAEDRTALRKEARQAARSVLPNATETKLFLTGNARSWRNFFELRASRFADAEIRRLANRIYEVLLPEAPSLFGDYVKVDLGDGTYELITAHKKV